MARKRKTPEETVGKPRQAEVPDGQGWPLVDAVRAIGVMEATCHRWQVE